MTRFIEARIESPDNSKPPQGLPKIWASSGADMGSSDVLRYSAKRVMWKVPGNTVEEDLAIGIRNIQAIFLSKFPGFDELFPRDHEGRIVPDNKRDAEQFVADRCGTLDKFKECFGSTPILRKSAPYFKGQFREALYFSFVPWGLDVGRLPLPVVDKDTKHHIGEDGIQWTSADYFHHKYGIDHRSLKRFLDGVESKNGISAAGSEVPLYKIESVEQRLETFFKLPKVNSETGRYSDENGLTWVTSGRLANELQMSGFTVQDLLKESGVSIIQGRSRGINVAILYNEDQALFALKRFLDLPSVEKGVGEYTDSEGTTWGTWDSLAKKWGKNYNHPPMCVEKGAAYIPGKDPRGRRIRLFNLRQAEAVLAENGLIPSINDIPPSEADRWLKELTGL